MGRSWLSRWRQDCSPKQVRSILLKMNFLSFWSRDVGMDTKAYLTELTGIFLISFFYPLSALRIFVLLWMHQNCYLKIFPHGLGVHGWRHKALEGWCCLKNLPTFEADIILNIPLSYNLPDYQIIWIGNKKGEFSVKSTYYVAIPIIHPFNEGESPRDDPRFPLWKKMWHLNIPAKIRIFAWRACMNALPTMHFLRTRGKHRWYLPYVWLVPWKYSACPHTLWHSQRGVVSTNIWEISLVDNWESYFLFLQHPCSFISRIVIKVQFYLLLFYSHTRYIYFIQTLFFF